ncbi:MAG TPA: hypothetical protein VFT00_03675 [Nocardioides sp.]|nr:hypothetical protein [Nocardioides sp.]
MGKGTPEREPGPDFDFFDHWPGQGEKESSEGRLGDEPRWSEPDPLFDESFIDPLTLADEPAPLAQEAPVITPTAPGLRRPRLVDDRPELSAASATSFDLTESTQRGPVISSPPEERDEVIERGTAVVAGPTTVRATPVGPVPPVPGSEEGEGRDVVEFAPRTRAHRLVEAMLVLAGAATAVASYVAYDSRSAMSIVVAATMALLTAVLWSATASSAVATLTVRDGRLDIMRAGSRHSFDLASQYTPIDVVGEPGSRDWKVLFHRRGMTPYVVDASMVDPVEFTRVVREFRPEA